MGYDEAELFRVVESYPKMRDGEPTGETSHFVHGPYTTISAARAARTRAKRETYYPGSALFTIESTPATWTEVE
jgi:hypothetical protein